ncbi:MAG TPA: MFS transporter, partial [Nitrospirae bacterium]|nr:MFS transporter [Nitrospirota bacterium]
MMFRRRLPSTVLALGFISLLTDLSSEMIYPLLPVFLTTVLGAGAFALGVIEGTAEMTASVLKILSGYLSDRTGKRKPIVTAGYTLSSLMRPLIGLATSWHQVLFLRFMDRVGKGIRTSPRDALIADVTEKGIRGRAYGLHRAMDHAGAVIGPIVALVLMDIFGLGLRSIFLLAIVPGIIVVITLQMGIKERARQAGEDGEERYQPRVHYGKDFFLFITGVTVFTLGNSSDAFLLLRLSEAGINTNQIVFLWSLFHIVKMCSTYLLGMLSDRLNRKTMIIAGWLYYSIIYLLFAFTREGVSLISIFLLYGIHFGFTEPAERAW